MSESRSHDFNFLHKPIVYGVVRLLYGVALSDSVSYTHVKVLGHYPWMICYTSRQWTDADEPVKTGFILFSPLRIMEGIAFHIRPFSVYSMVDGSRQRFFAFVGGKKIKNKNLLAGCHREIWVIFRRFR